MAYFWKTELIVPFWVMPHIDNALENFFEAMCWHAVQPDNPKEALIGADEPWRLEAITAHKPDIKHIKATLALAATAYNFTIADITLIKEKERDWIAENLEHFPPINADCFYIYGSHITTDIPADKIGIKMDASTAFGTGKHATTKLCLLALAQLKKQNIQIQKALDMGAGSGILSFAIAKLWPQIEKNSILAVDIDEAAPIVIERYAIQNQVENKIIALRGNGYHTQEVKQSEGFDCIVANILANPLIEMAPMLAEKLKSGGYAILSGFLTSDWPNVQKAHEDYSLNIIDHKVEDNWVAIIMQKTQ